MDSLTEFGKDIKRKLIDLGKNQKWLQDEVTARTGLYCDSSYLYKAMSGKYVSPNLIAAICEILELPEEKV